MNTPLTNWLCVLCTEYNEHTYYTSVLLRISLLTTDGQWCRVVRSSVDSRRRCFVLAGLAMQAASIYTEGYGLAQC